METKSKNQAKKRKLEEKTVVRVKLDIIKEEENQQQHGKEEPPPDSWSWRKYGKKTIKGSSITRGYYRCITKGCLAKKQVERSEEDASIFTITYTSSHNHPEPGLGPDTQIPNQAQKNQSPKKKPKATKNKNSDTSSLHNEPKQEEEKPYVVKLDTLTPHEVSINNLLDGDHKSDFDNITGTQVTAEHCDFFDELNELQLPISLSFN